MSCVARHRENTSSLARSRDTPRVLREAPNFRWQQAESAATKQRNGPVNLLNGTLQRNTWKRSGSSQRFLRDKVALTKNKTSLHRAERGAGKKNSLSIKQTRDRWRVASHLIHPRSSEAHVPRRESCSLIFSHFILEATSSRRNVEVEQTG